MLRRASQLQNVEQSEYCGFLRNINGDVRRFCDRFRRDGCYRFADSIYKSIMRNMRHQMPAEVDLEAILPLVSLMYTI